MPEGKSSLYYSTAHVCDSNKLWWIITRKLKQVGFSSHRLYFNIKILKSRISWRKRKTEWNGCRLIIHADVGWISRRSLIETRSENKDAIIGLNNSIIKTLVLTCDQLRLDKLVGLSFTVIRHTTLISLSSITVEEIRSLCTCDTDGAFGWKRL